ncbi:MAG: MBL fold metallo-hydrolase, partial [Solirubrobacteraceae bacterium]
MRPSPAPARRSPLRLTVTGSGTPLPCPGRAGPGALVEADGVLLQFDAGRGTVLRLAEAGVNPSALDA